MSFIYDLADTWTDGLSTYTAMKMNVTDTASAAASLLMDLQVGGTSKFNVEKDGDLVLGQNLYFGNEKTGVYLQRAAASTIDMYLSGGLRYRFGPDLLSIAGAAAGYGSGTTAGNPDVFLLRGGANVWEMRNLVSGTSAQAFRVYNTYTDASNYERGVIAWSGGDFIIGTQYLGTGAARQTHIYGQTIRMYQSNAAGWYFNAGGEFTYEGTGSGFIGMKEQTAPAAGAANSVRIFAQDNGGGKTQLMAIFATGAAQQIAIEP